MASQLFSPGTVVSSVWLNEADTSTHPQLSSVAGTNAITGAGPVSLLSYVIGQTFRFVPIFSNTTSTTININSLGAKAITKYGSTALVAGDLLAGMVAEIVYDGTNFQLSNPRTLSTTATGRLLNVQVFNVSGTYTPTVGTTFVVVEGVGGGGGGGGTVATAAGQMSVGGSGGPGAYARSIYFSGFSGVAVTCGAAGLAGALGGAGGNGGSTLFGALLTIPGGQGGAVGTASAAPVIGTRGPLGLPVGSNILGNNPGTSGLGWGSFAAGIGVSGFGGTSPLGGGAPSAATNTAGNVTGNAAVGAGGGGSGAVSGAAQGGAGGVAVGGGGQLVVYEYS